MTSQPPDDDIPEDQAALRSEEQRTDLAWSRSGLALAVGAAAILKVVVDIGDYRAPVIIAVVLGAGAIAWALALVEARYVSSPSLAGRRLADQRKLKFVARVTTLFALCAIAIALLPNR
jgi:hypothetical protein